MVLPIPLNVLITGEAWSKKAPTFAEARMLTTEQIRLPALALRPQSGLRGVLAAVLRQNPNAD
jgi:hypothetical protein